MAETKHTPGPWVYSTDCHDDWGTVRTMDGSFVCQAKDPRVTVNDLHGHRAAKTDPWEANARLIAAAPAMSEILDELFASGIKNGGNVIVSRTEWVRAETRYRAALSSAVAKDGGVDA